MSPVLLGKHVYHYLGNSNIDDILLGKINNGNDVVKEHARLMNFFNSKDVSDRINNIDVFLGTSYKESIDLWNNTWNRRVYMNQSLPSYGRIYTPKDKEGVGILDNQFTRIELKPNAPITTYGHETRHMLDRLDRTSRYSILKDSQSNSRTKALLSDDNGNSLIVKDPKVIQWYKDHINSEKIEEVIDYMTNENEISSFLGELIDEYAIKNNGKIPVFSKESFESMLSSSNSEASQFINRVYKGFIANKQKFIGNINKYAFSYYLLNKITNEKK